MYDFNFYTFVFLCTKLYDFIFSQVINVKRESKRLFFYVYKLQWNLMKPGPWVNRNTVHSDLNFKSPVFSLIIFVKNHWITGHCTFRIPALTCGPNTLITVIIYFRKPVMIRSIMRVFTYMWISIGSKGNRIEMVYSKCVY